MKVIDYNILTKDGNIAFYKSCEVTEVFLVRKEDKAILNLFTIIIFEEKPFEKTNENYLTNEPIKINNEYTLGIKRYWLSLKEVQTIYTSLETQNKWCNNDISSKLKLLTKQYIPSDESNRLNQILKNNYHNGSYILEFFDEEKTAYDFLLNVEAINKFNILSQEIKKLVPIDLSVVRDRVGNFIFQFPITILEASSKALKSWDGIILNFSWHSLIQSPPDCLLQLESTIDKNYMGSIIEEYNKADRQILNIGNLDQLIHFKIWLKEPNLILYTFDGSFIRNFDFNMGIISPEPRFFEIEGKITEVQITSNQRGNQDSNPIKYTNYITNNLYDAEKKQLEKSLHFKQYNGKSNDSLKDLQQLIMQNDEDGVFLWDPFLSSLDILRTLYYSKSGGVSLRAIGSINKTVRDVYSLKGKSIEDIIKGYKALLDNPKNNNFHLNIEFRIQHSNFGWAFHDRFLIFPGNSQKKPQVYSLGTSINSYGQNHHILQIVSHPQPVVDAFNELWKELNHQKCIVWKFPQ